MIPLATLGLGSIAELASNILNRFFPPEMSEAEKTVKSMELQAMMYQQWKEPIQMELSDLADARANERAALTNAGKSMNSLRAGVTVYGGYVAQSVLFWNALSPYFGYNRVPLSTEEYAILGGIVAFYYGKRLTEKMTGASARQ
jgi:hypothetical protein